MQKLVALFCTLASAIWTIGNASDAAAARQTTYPLRAERSRGTTDRVEVTFEVAGELKMIEDGKVQRGKMSVVASFLYDEKSLDAPGEPGRPLRSIRYYDKAEGVVRSGERAYRPTLKTFWIS